MSKKADTTIADRREAGKSNNKPRGRVVIISERCKGCGYCVEFCPPGVLAMTSRFNAKGYHYPKIVDEEECSGCDLCGIYCPDFAIAAALIPRKKETS